MYDTLRIKKVKFNKYYKSPLFLIKSLNNNKYCIKKDAGFM